MNLYDILNDASNLNVTISGGQLRECIDYCVAKTRQDIERQVADSSAETHFSRNRTADVLGVNLSTLHRWSKSGYLTPITVGGRRLYRKSDIDKILSE